MAMAAANMKFRHVAMCLKLKSGGGTSTSVNDNWWHMGFLADGAILRATGSQETVYAQPAPSQIKSERIEDSFEFEAKMLEGTSPDLITIALGRSPISYPSTSMVAIVNGETNLIVEVKLAMIYGTYTDAAAVTGCTTVHIPRASITSDFEAASSALHSKQWSDLPIKISGIGDVSYNFKVAGIKYNQTVNLKVGTGVGTTDRYCINATTGFFADMSF